MRVDTYRFCFRFLQYFLLCVWRNEFYLLFILGFLFFFFSEYEETEMTRTTRNMVELEIFLINGLFIKELLRTHTKPIIIIGSRFYVEIIFGPKVYHIFESTRYPFGRNRIMNTYGEESFCLSVSSR